MSTRWFFSSAQHGVPAGVSAGTQVLFRRKMAVALPDVTADGPQLPLAGPGHVAGIDASLVIREEPPPGTTNAAENILASVEFAYADLPWLLPVTSQTGDATKRYPWLVLVVLSDAEAAPPRDANPLPILTAPQAALPPLEQSWAWAHVEARLGDAVQDAKLAAQDTQEEVRARSAAVVARLLCPRRLLPDTTWIAAVVPATAAGVSAGLGLDPPAAATSQPAWRPTDGGATIDLPVYHWWSFRTADGGDFKQLAELLNFTKATDLGLGSHSVDVSQPWRAQPPTGAATVTLDGALRAPAPPDVEQWSDQGLQARFRAKLRAELDAPAARRDPTTAPGDRDTTAVAPPLYGSHHSAQQTVPDNDQSWMSSLNLEVRRRVAAAVGARYVQLEQEFLMARAWEQAGAIREANRMLATAELATVGAEASHAKHLAPLAAADLISTMAPMAARVFMSDQQVTLTQALASANVPAGMVTTAYSRLTRTGGGLGRRIDRVAGGATQTGTLIDAGLARLVAAGQPSALPDALRQRTAPMGLQLANVTHRIAGPGLPARKTDDPRPLGPIMAHPNFSVAIGEEILARWPDWAIPGIDSLPADSVTILATNPGFVAALLVGLNQEFNRELLWRGFPTDQRGTPFKQFWPAPAPAIDEIARWQLETPLDRQIPGGEGSLALLIRGQVLRRFPATTLVAVQGDQNTGMLPQEYSGIPANQLPLDESTVLYLFPGLTEDAARTSTPPWFFVLREPMRGTQFGFHLGPAKPMTSWADLTWDTVPTSANRYVDLAAPAPTQPSGTAPPDAPVWARDAADIARIAFQRPFQLAFAADEMLGP